MHIKNVCKTDTWMVILNCSCPYMCELNSMALTHIGTEKIKSVKSIIMSRKQKYGQIHTWMAVVKESCPYIRVGRVSQP